MLNDTLFSELVDASRDLPGNRWAVGGNAPVMAGRMAIEGCDVLLGGSFSPDFTDVLSEHIAGTHLFPSFSSHPCDLVLFGALPLPSPISICPPCLVHAAVPHPHPSVFPVAGNTVEEPDIHLILEYPSGASWGHYTSRRANRYVIVECLVCGYFFLDNILGILRDKPKTHCPTTHSTCFVFKCSGF